MCSQFPASADNKTWNLVLNSAEFQDKVSDGSIVNQFVKLQPLRTLEGRFIFSEVSDVTFGPEVFMGASSELRTESVLTA